MATFHKLKVKDIRKETPDCVSIELEVPPNLVSDFDYIPGQYITFKLDVGGEIRRSYSICSAKGEGLRVAVKKTPDGRGSVWLNETPKVGDQLEVMTPMGNFYTKYDASNKKSYHLFAGGSGITPMFSIVKTVLKEEPNSNIVLYYGNRSEEQIIFKDAIRDVEQSSNSRLKVLHVLEENSNEDLKGRLDEMMVKKLLSANVNSEADNEFFICGPGPMMENVKKVLEESSIPKEKIHIEYFSAVIDATKDDSSDNESVVDVDSEVTVMIDGIETTFKLNSNGESILDAAMDAGADAPFSCKGAVCCTCRAKVMEGEVSMDMNYALTDDEVENGYILTCQSHPKSSKVVVDYDQP